MSPIGPNFDVMLDPASVALAESDRQSGATFALEFGGSGSSDYGVYSVFGDLGFNVTFVTVPEPGSFALVLTGAVALAGYSRHRRSARA